MKKLEEMIGKSVIVNNLKLGSICKDIICGEIEFNNQLIKAYIIQVKKININSNYRGKIIGILEKETQKVVIVSDDDSKMEYIQLVEFFKDFEEFKDFKYKCQFETSSGAIVYKIINGQPEYCVIYSKNNFPGFPKGHIEYGENERQTAIREVKEEVGLNIQLKDGFRESISYIVHDTSIEKTVIFFLAEIDSNQKININENEISKYEFVTYEKAKDILDDKLFEILTVANKYISVLKDKEEFYKIQEKYIKNL